MRARTYTKTGIFLGLITGYARNVTSFNSLQSAYIFYVIYLFINVFLLLNDVACLQANQSPRGSIFWVIGLCHRERYQFSRFWFKERHSIFQTTTGTKNGINVCETNK